MPENSRSASEGARSARYSQRLPAPTGKAPIYLTIYDGSWRPYWSWDDVYKALDTYGATDENGEICRPFFEAVEQNADGSFSVVECRRR